MSKTNAANLVGNVYKYLTVIRRAENRAGKTWWLCRCTCGVEKEVSAANLKAGSTTSCGCMKYKSITEAKGDYYEDLTGVRFNSLVPQHTTRNEKGKLLWVCLCDCGNTYVAYSGHLRAGSSKTCGCGPKGPVKPNLLGNTYGRLTVIKEHPTKGGGGSSWDCLCTCGNISNQLTGSLEQGGTVSCGCHRKEQSSIRFKELSVYQKGENHPMWNSELTAEDRVKNRQELGYREWVVGVFKGNDFTCQLCGVRGGKLNAHHLNSYRAFPEGRTDPKNGVTLCVSCHRKFHSAYGTKGNTVEQWQNYLDNLKEAA